MHAISPTKIKSVCIPLRKKYFSLLRDETYLLFNPTNKVHSTVCFIPTPTPTHTDTLHVTVGWNSIIEVHGSVGSLHPQSARYR